MQKPAFTLSRTSRTANGRHWSAMAVVWATVGCAPATGEPAAGQARQWQRSISLPGSRGRSTQELAYLAAGDPQGQRLILVHGTPGDAGGWAAYLQQPPPGSEVFAIDRPGFGRSAPTQAVTSLAAQARAVAALLPTDGRRAVLLGHSLGGPIVAWVAAEHPERVAGIILLAASMDPAQEQVHPMQRVGAWGPIRALLPRAIRHANAELLALEPELVALAQRLPSVTAPVFIVHGTADDLVPVANVAYMQARLGASRCQRTTLLEGRNHFLPWNSEAAVREAIAAAMSHAC